MALPNGYTQLEYIQSSGTQLINTDYYPNNNTRIVMDVEGSSSQTSSHLYFGTTDGNGYYCGKIDSVWRIYGWYGSTYTTINYGSAEAYAARKTIDFNKNVLTVNGESSTITANTFSVTYPLMLFGYNQAGTYTLHAVAKLFSCKIYDNGTLVRDFIPCKNASGVVGLWDDVNSAFYTNAGTGTFTAGAEIIGNHYTLINGTAYEFSEGSAMISGTVYDISKGLVMVDGTVREMKFSSGTRIGDLPVGTSVFASVGGTQKEFVVVHQGLPSSMYDDSCNGTWLLMKNVYEIRTWHSSAVNIYQSSTINTYLNNTFWALFDDNTKTAIKTAKIPYVNGNGGSAVASGASGLSVKVFLLSGYEVGWTSSQHANFVADGACLEYFTGCAKVDAKRIGYLNSSATNWWLRSPYKSSGMYSWLVNANGDFDAWGCDASGVGVRPAMIVSQDASVDENYQIVE